MRLEPADLGESTRERHRGVLTRARPRAWLGFEAIPDSEVAFTTSYAALRFDCLYSCWKRESKLALKDDDDDGNDEEYSLLSAPNRRHRHRRPGVLYPDVSHPRTRERCRHLVISTKTRMILDNFEDS